MGKRPVRLYNASRKLFMPWRCYKYQHRAHIGALVEARWSKVGTTIEVIDISRGHKQLGSYTRGPHNVTFTRGGK